MKQEEKTLVDIDVVCAVLKDAIESWRDFEPNQDTYFDLEKFIQDVRKIILDKTK